MGPLSYVQMRQILAEIKAGPLDKDRERIVGRLTKVIDALETIERSLSISFGEITAFLLESQTCDPDEDQPKAVACLNEFYDQLREWKQHKEEVREIALEFYKITGRRVH